MNLLQSDRLGHGRSKNDHEEVQEKMNNWFKFEFTLTNITLMLANICTNQNCVGQFNVYE